jgi:hypothetical protein
MRVARYEVPGMGKKYGPVPEGRLKSGCALNYACRISRLLRIKRPPRDAALLRMLSSPESLSGLATFIQSLRDKNPGVLLQPPLS